MSAGGKFIGLELGGFVIFLRNASFILLMMSNCISDINECLTGAASCPDNSICSNQEPGYTCVCVSGYIMLGAVCQGNN